MTATRAVGDEELHWEIVRLGFAAWYVGPPDVIKEFPEAESMWGRVADAILPLIATNTATLRADLQRAAALAEERGAEAKLHFDAATRLTEQLAATQAERDVARAQAFEEAAQIAMNTDFRCSWEDGSDTLWRAAAAIRAAASATPAGKEGADGRS